jgi:uncharacterized lipoprotein YddW (UPF0748 family)
MKHIFTFILLLTFSLSIKAQSQYPKRELRGAWIATVENIDWPRSNTETSGEQIKELVDIIDSLKLAGINAVYFQVRTECDALYKSSYEPWSYYLTGQQGKVPDPYYDPLAFAISEAHSKGMELHAWFNPYRAVRKVGDYPIADNHVTKTHPDWILDFGTYKMLNPGIPAVRHYIAKIVADVVRRYNVDGIHFDDYFYPYVPHITNQDSAAFAEYGGNFTNVDDWRRNNINQMIAEVHDTIEAINSDVKFGVSPFGIVENKYAGTDGFESYNKIYCDPLNWIKNKTVDYVAPQLYWEIGNKAADYAKLLPWWASVIDGRQLYIGIFSSKLAARDYKGLKTELEDEINLNSITPNVSGTIFFSAKSITQNYSGLADTLENSLFKYPALVPAMPWKDSVPPLAPQNLVLTQDSSGVTLNWEKPPQASDGDYASQYIIYRFAPSDVVDFDNAKNIIFITPGDQTTFKDTRIKKHTEYTYVVSSLDKMKNESEGNASAVITVK